MFDAARADPAPMELTVPQARAVAHIRGKAPDAILTFHERPWGYILEVAERRPGGRSRTVALARFESDGAIVPDRAVA
jgi:hypothetical protein